jgi:hypothetical protein
LREERKKAKKNKDKYVGINSSGAGFGSMSSSKSSYSDFSSSRNTNNMDDLNDKDWRTNKSSSIQERITNLASNLKNIVDNAPDDEKNISEEENDQNETYNELGFENKPKKESASNKVRCYLITSQAFFYIFTDRYKESPLKGFDCILCRLVPKVIFLEKSSHDFYSLVKSQSIVGLVKFFKRHHSFNGYFLGKRL